MGANGQGVKIIFELTNVCNFGCTHCIRNEHGPADYLELDVIDKVLAQATSYQDVTFVALTGGEPTLHPSFEAVLDVIAKHDLKFGFVTNGWHFTRKTFGQVAAHLSRLESVTFSIDGATEETHDAIRRRDGSFRRLMEAITLCRARGVSYHVNFVVTRANRTEIEQMALLTSGLGCTRLFFGHCQPTPDAISAGLVLTAKERREVESEVAQLQSALRMQILFAGDHYSTSLFHQCDQLRMREFNVDCRGRLTACCMLSNYRGGESDTDIIADLNRESFFEAHKRLVEKIAMINAEKITRFTTGAVRGIDHFICSHCLDHYDKVPNLEQILEPSASTPVTSA